MRHNQTLTGHDELHRLAVEAFDASGRTQSSVADDLGKTRGAISRALKEPNPSLSGLQKEIVSLLTPYRVVEATTFRLVKKDAGYGGSA